jgi:hypothetical protein
MSLQKAVTNEWFITHATGKWTLPTMYSLMSLQFPLLSECFVTDPAEILALLLKISESAL